jgi:predicted HTH domain antitoxin
MTMSEDMNSLLTQMQRFRDELMRFNEQLRSSFNALELQHDAVSPLWQDEFRDEYDLIWDRLDHEMKEYLNREGLNYEEFLDRKIVKLNDYLGGRR